MVIFSRIERLHLDSDTKKLKLSCIIKHKLEYPPKKLTACFRAHTFHGMSESIDFSLSFLKFWEGQPKNATGQCH